jgi:hypothetical protein
MTIRSLALAAILAIAATVAPRARADETALITADSHAILLDVVSNGVIDRERIRDAIARELGVNVVLRSDASSADRHAQLTVRVDADVIDLTFRDDQGDTTHRAVPAPHELRERISTIAYLAGNLARDQTGGALYDRKPQLNPPPPILVDHRDAVQHDDTDGPPPPAGHAKFFVETSGGVALTPLGLSPCNESIATRSCSGGVGPSFANVCLTSTTSPHQRQLHFPIDLLV